MADVENTQLVTLHIKCVECGYSLRSLNIHGYCPECGSPVLETLTPTPLAHADPAWLKRILTGLNLAIVAMGAVLLVAVCKGVVIMLSRFTTMVSRNTTSHLAAGGIVAAMLTGMALWLLTTPEPGSLAQERYLSWRRITRLLSLPIIGVIAFLYRTPPPSSRLAQWLIDPLATLVLVVCVMTCAAGVSHLLAQWADRFERPVLARRVRVYLIWICICFVTSMVVDQFNTRALLRAMGAGIETAIASSQPGGKELSDADIDSFANEVERKLRFSVMFNRFFVVAALFIVYLLNAALEAYRQRMRSTEYVARQLAGGVILDVPDDDGSGEWDV